MVCLNANHDDNEFDLALPNHVTLTPKRWASALAQFPGHWQQVLAIEIGSVPNALG
jgi:hypothetical protein